MTARVNLLPEASREGARQAAARAVALVGLLVLVVALGGVWWWLNAQVNDAEERLATEIDRTAELRIEVEALAPFRDLEQLREGADARIGLALSGEISFAGFLQDVALATPTDAQLDSLTLALDFSGDADDYVVGNFQMAGKSLQSHAPGVERLLLEFDKVGIIAEPFLNSSTLDDPDDPAEPVVTFSLDGFVNANALTRRYVDGVPEVVR